MAVNFKNEEEVKEYLENIGVEYRFSCFKEKNAEGCQLLGDYLEAVKQDFETSAKVYKENCDERHYVKSCLKYGAFIYRKKNAEKDLKTAFDYFKKSCELNSPDGCLYSGVMQTQEKGMEHNYVEGIKDLEKSCSLGNATACFYGSGLYMAGAEGVPANKVRASELALQACNGGNLYACMNISRMYKLGDGVEKDEDKAKLYKNRAKEIRDERTKRGTIGLQQHIE